jgi:ribose transport system ATP-binding protein
VVLAARGLRTRAHPGHVIDLVLRAGEIVGIAGLVGAGRSELLRALFAADPPLAGDIEVGGRPVALRRPRDAVAAGLAFVPEDRKEQGLLLDASVRDNLALAALPDLQRQGFVRRQAEDQLALGAVERLDIKTPSLQQVVRWLSGGNQQKVVLGKWLPLRPRVLFLDEPTRGIDVGAKQEVYRLIDALAEDGVGILFVSSELEEILALCDRVLVLWEGRLQGELAHDRLGEHALMQLMTGGGA